MKSEVSISVLLPNLQGGGAERVAVNLANDFARRGYSIEVVLLSCNGPFLMDLDRSIRVIDLQVRRFRGLLLPLLRYLRQKKPDSLLVFMWPLTVMALWAKILARVDTRVVVVEHTTWSKDEIVRSLFTRFLAQSSMHCSFKKASAVVAVSHGVADDLSHFARIERALIKVIYNPIVCIKSSTQRVLPKQTPAPWWNGTHRCVLAVGALKPVKDYATLILAFMHLLKYVNSRLLILGEGECRTELETQVKDLGMEGYVFIPGFAKVLSPYYQRADLFVSSSTAEGFGNVIVEALEAGTPVVSTDCQSGPREILLNGRYGSLVPVGDPLALASAMIKSLEVKHDVEALKARARYFSIDEAANEYLRHLTASKNDRNLVAGL
jgi:glycosyltransferase involved in cell wall biosynthesis